MSYIFSEAWVKKANNSMRKSDSTRSMAHCITCEVDFSIASQGYKAIELHMQTPTHILIDKLKRQNRDSNDVRIPPANSQSRPAPQKSEDLTEEIHKMRAEIEALTTLKDQTIADRDEVIRQFDELQQEHAQVQKDLKKKSAQLEIAADLNNSKINVTSTLAEEESVMKKEIEELKKKLYQLEEQLQQDASKARELEREKSSLQSLVCDMEREFRLERQQQKEKYEKTQKILDGLRQQRQALREELKSTRQQPDAESCASPEGKQFQQQIKELSERREYLLCEAEKNKISNDKKMDFYKTHICQLQQQLKSMEQTAAAAASDASAEMDLLKNKIEDLTKQREILQFEVESYEKDRSELKQQLRSAEQISPNSNETVNWLITKIKEFIPEPMSEDEEDELSVELMILDSSLDQLSKEIHRLIKLCANRQLDLKRKDQEMQALKEAFMKKYEQKTAPNSSTDMDEHTMKVMLTALDECLDTHFASLERVDLQDVFHEIKQMMNNQKNIASKLSEKIYSLKSQLKDLKREREEVPRLNIHPCVLDLFKLQMNQ